LWNLILLLEKYNALIEECVTPKFRQIMSLGSIYAREHFIGYFPIVHNNGRHQMGDFTEEFPQLILPL